MAIDILAIVQSAIKPITELVDELHTSKEEKAAIKLAAANASAKLTLDLTNVQKDIIIAEAQGESWLQRNWRPVTMLSFVFMLVWNYVVAPLGSWISIMNGGVEFPILPMEQAFFDVLWVGIGGYVVGRTAEKGIKNWRAAAPEPKE